jgi:sialate O-acetylesterase
MVQSSDLVGGQHPPCKSGYGARAARVALGAVYGKDVAYSGPVYKSHTLEGNEVHITFDHVGKGLTFAHSDKIHGFEIQKGHHWYFTTDARIEGNKVIVSSPEVEKPIGVRYGWTIHRFEYANLFNKDGLPTVQFTTEKE